MSEGTEMVDPYRHLLWVNEMPGWEPDANGHLMPNAALMRLGQPDPRNGPCTVPGCETCGAKS